MNVFLRIGTALLLLFPLILQTGCSVQTHLMEPCIAYTPRQEYIHSLPSPFPPLDDEERLSSWGVEILVAQAFAKDLDLYRAVGCYRRALVLLQENNSLRKTQALYGIALCNFLGHRYQETIDAIQSTPLWHIHTSSEAYANILLMLEESLWQVGQIEQAEHLLKVIESENKKTASDLHAFHSVTRCDELCDFFNCYPCLQTAMQNYEQLALSPGKARTLNALFPGAGYLYVGQTSSAFTSFVLNTLFIWAAWQFFDHGYWAAGTITLGFEAGWYFGGINGAGLAAEQWNGVHYELFAKEAIFKERLFPVFHLQYGF